MAEGNGNGNGNGWDAGFWRFARYASIIGAGAWFAFSLRADVKSVGGAVDSLHVEVRQLADAAMTRNEAERLLDEANEVWAGEAKRHGATFRPLHMTRGGR